MEQGLPQGYKELIVMAKEAEYTLSTKRCMLGNQDRSLARVCIVSTVLAYYLAVGSCFSNVFDDFTELNEVKILSPVCFRHFQVLFLELQVFDRPPSCGIIYDTH